MWNQDMNQSGFSGGGFNTPQGNEKQKASKRSNNIVPVTIGQLLAAKQEDDVFISGNTEINQVKLIGVVKSVNETATRIDYLIDDMTGPDFEVRMFNSVESDQEEAIAAPKVFPVNSYVCVHGTLRSFGGKRTVNALKIRAVDDMNQLSCHMLEVIYASISGSQQQMPAASSSSMSRGNTMNDQGDTGGLHGLTPLQAQVQNIIRSDQSEEGTSVDEVCNRLRSVAPKAVREAIDFLNSEGHIYTTIDDDHFQATD